MHIITIWTWYVLVDLQTNYILTAANLLDVTFGSTDAKFRNNVFTMGSLDWSKCYKD